VAEVTLTINRTGVGEQSFQMVWRAYDDGIAYRYRIPGSGLKGVNGEASNWILPSGTKVWYQNGTDYYEGFHVGAYIDSFYSFIGMPTTIALKGGSYASGYGLISEAALFNYSGMTLRKNNYSRVLQGVFQDDNYNATTPYTDYCLFYVNGGTYTITTLQPRYLNVTDAQGITVDISGAYTFAQSLELKGGNAYWLISEGVYDNEIDTGDAALVGAEYGGSGAVEGNSGDVNFDGIVNILDLSLVGGNYTQTSLSAYEGWTP